MIRVNISAVYITPSRIKIDITVTQSNKQLRTHVFCDKAVLVVSVVPVVSKKPRAFTFESQEVHHPSRTSWLLKLKLRLRRRGYSLDRSEKLETCTRRMLIIVAECSLLTLAEQLHSVPFGTSKFDGTLEGNRFTKVRWKKQVNILIVLYTHEPSGAWSFPQ